MKKFLLAIVFGTSAFLISGMWARSAHAVFIVDIEQVGPEVAITGSGNLNLSGLSFDFSEIEAGLIDPRVGELVLAGRIFNLYRLISMAPSQGRTLSVPVLLRFCPK